MPLTVSGEKMIVESAAAPYPTSSIELAVLKLRLPA